MRQWFSSLKLFTYLKEHLGILSLGTITANRIAGSQLEPAKNLEEEVKEILRTVLSLQNELTNVCFQQAS